MNKSTQESKPREYYVEFHEVLDNYIGDWLDQIEKQNNQLFMINNSSVKNSIWHLLFYQFMWSKEKYSQLRNQDHSIHEALAIVTAPLSRIHISTNNNTIITENELLDHEWGSILSDSINQTIVYIYNERQLVYLTPLIKQLNTPILLLSEYEISEDIDLPDYVTLLPIVLSAKKYLQNTFIEQNYPYLYQYANTLSILLDILKPKGIICLEGCHLQPRLLATFAQTAKIPSICIQQGWPSFMHSGFRRFPYDYFFSWGDKFNELWKVYNTKTKFLSMGYMYKVIEAPLSAKKCVCFFLQDAVLLSDTEYLQEMLNLITASAKIYRNIIFLVKEHPETKVPSAITRQWEKFKNITIVTDWPLDKVFAQTIVSVSHFSSTLAEGLAHNCIPLVYDPTSDSCYSPDVETLHLGLIAKTPQEFQSKLKKLLGNSTNFQQNIIANKELWFSSIDNITLEKMTNQIYNIL